MPRQLSIAFVAPLVAPLAQAHAYGNQIFLVDVAQGLAARGHRVVVYAAQGSQANVPIEPISVDARLRGRFLLLRENLGDEADLMRRAFEDVGARLRRSAHDVVSQHACDPEAIELRTGVPTLHTLHVPPMHAATISAVRRCEGALASVSERCAALWRESTGRDVMALPNGVPECAVPATRVEPLALVVGRIAREKGTAVAIRAAHAANLVPLVAGPVYDEHYFRTEVEPLLDHARCIGTVSRARLRRWMARATVTLMPVAWEEPFGLVAAEAQLAGCPVVGYRTGALPEVIEEGIGGFLVDSGDEPALAGAVERSRALDRHVVAGRARARFGMAACIDRYEEALGGLA